MDQIDTSFDFYSDTPVGKDPDSNSPTLRRYHQVLWSKELPYGGNLQLGRGKGGSYLESASQIGTMSLSSDAITNTFRHWRRMKGVISDVNSENVTLFFKIGSTIGAYTVFPSKTVNRRQNINMARGTNGKISDRFDLTLECIRRHFFGQPSPLSGVLDRYRDFFSLFVDFKGYVDFFLLNDLVEDSANRIKFFLPFDEFTTAALPKNSDEYLVYLANSIEFIRARNQRIDRWSKSKAGAARD